MIVGQPWAALWLIFWVITNGTRFPFIFSPHSSSRRWGSQLTSNLKIVATSFYNLDLAPRFYHWGYAWPLHNIVEAARAILFNTHSRVPQNFGILLGWIVVNVLFFPFCCYFMRWKSKKSAQKEKEKKEKDEE